MEQPELLHIIGEEAKWPNKFGKKLFGVSQRVKHALKTWHSDPTHRYFPQRNKNLCSYAHLCTTVYSGSIGNWPKLEMTQMILNRWIDKHLHDGLLPSSNKEDPLLIQEKLLAWVLKVFGWVKEDSLKVYIWCDSIYLQKDKNIRKTDMWLPGEEVEGGFDYKGRFFTSWNYFVS